MSARLLGFACVLGAALPLSALGAFVVEEGADAGAFVDQVTGSELAVMAWADVLVTGLVVIGLTVAERARGLRRWWLPALATALAGPSLGLPLLLLLRERARAAAEPPPIRV